MPDGDAVPDIYTDQIGLLTTEWEVIMLLNAIIPSLPSEITATEGGEPMPQRVSLPVELRAIVRMSHAHAKTVNILMKRVLKAYEGASGEIQLPRSVIERHNIQPEDWQ